MIKAKVTYGGSEPRDTERKRVYDAEAVLHPKVLGKHSRTFKTVAEVQAYTDKLVGSAWFQRRWDHVARIHVTDGRGRRRGGCRRIGPGIYEIAMPTFTRYEAYVLHEIAHACTVSRNRAPHGPIFVRAFLELVAHKMGRGDAQALRFMFKEHRVKIGPAIQLVTPLGMAAGPENVIPNRYSSPRQGR